ncbi:uncharacterized protein BDR25DRAFT_372414 [Lindgomyces ingoldianus]|uniref:Uncharacterized protein n=1 Tax=Lindgomyces ingoldianus TaxID=673940 RepID=A0ACB6QQC4_9PLEO|nr:uncharacterized protein BDR25DRAFT_372414 [Lindgomyces ingoldianus]KAF2469199.1 hypothetical protein BDR25DRAFT_372414 [Lindgomyces ingoldianus]
MNLPSNSTGFNGPPDPSLIPSPPTEAAVELAHAFAGIAITLNIISFMVFGGRIWTRCFPVLRLGWDDYIISVAYVLVLVDSILLLITVPFVFGRDPATITLKDVEESTRHAILAEPIWAWSMAAVKISVAAMLLRLEQERHWRRFLWAMIVIQLFLGVYNTITQLVQCVPLHAAWDLLGVVEAKCWRKNAIRNNLICVSTVNIATDFVFALIPITFLRKIQRPLGERIVIGILMALGIFAAAASIVKVTAAANFGRTNDPTKEGISIGTWSCVEEQVGFIAACIPCLRSPFQKVLSYFGLISTQNKTTYGRAYGQMHGEGGNSSKPKDTHSRMKSGGRGAVIKMKNMRSTDAQSEENILTSNLEGKNGEIWCTTEVRMIKENTTQVLKVEKGHGRGQSSWADGSEQEEPTWAVRKSSNGDVV